MSDVSQSTPELHKSTTPPGRYLVMECPDTGKLIDVTDIEPGVEFDNPYTGKKLRCVWKLERYTLTRRIATGGMSLIYEAQDTQLNRIVCVKILKNELSQQPGFIENFAKEAKLTASISHPNIVKVYHFGQHNGVAYLAMELLEGGSLDDLINKLGKVPEQRALEIGIQAAHGLREAYRHGLLHRDVKPGNILLTKQGTVKIVDFGLSMPVDEARQYNGEIFGTPYYVSPEKLESKGEDVRSDIYSLAASLFHAIAGRAPYEAETVSLVAWKHLKASKVSLKAFAPHVHNETVYVINKALERDPALRFQNYDELILALEAALKTCRSISVKQEQKVQDLTGSQEEQKIDLYVLFGLLVLVVVIILTMILFSKTLQQRKDPLQEMLQETQNTQQKSTLVLPHQCRAIFY